MTTIKTEKREYKTFERDGIWNAKFQPINPKTGLAWQRDREIYDGHNVYCLVSGTGMKSMVIHGQPLTFKEVVALGWDSFQTGFATEDDAIAAIERHKAKASK